MTDETPGLHNFLPAAAELGRLSDADLHAAERAANNLQDTLSTAMVTVGELLWRATLNKDAPAEAGLTFDAGVLMMELARMQRAAADSHSSATFIQHQRELLAARAAA